MDVCVVFHFVDPSPKKDEISCVKILVSDIVVGVLFQGTFTLSESGSKSEIFFVICSLFLIFFACRLIFSPSPGVNRPLYLFSVEFVLKMQSRPFLSQIHTHVYLLFTGIICVSV